MTITCVVPDDDPYWLSPLYSAVTVVVPVGSDVVEHVVVPSESTSPPSHDPPDPKMTEDELPELFDLRRALLE